MAAVISAVIPVSYWGWYNGKIPVTTFTIIILAYLEISHLPSLNQHEQQRLKVRHMIQTTWSCKRKAIENSVRNKTVGAFSRLELRIQIYKSSIFVFSWLVMTRSPTLPGLPRAGTDSKPHHFPYSFEERLLWKLLKPLSKNFWMTMSFWFLKMWELYAFCRRVFFWYNSVKGL